MLKNSGRGLTSFYMSHTLYWYIEPLYFLHVLPALKLLGGYPEDNL